MRDLHCDVAEGAHWDELMAVEGWRVRRPGDGDAPSPETTVAVTDQHAAAPGPGRPPTVFLANPGDPCRDAESVDAVVYRPAESAVLTQLATELNDARKGRPGSARISDLQSRYVEGLGRRVDAIDADLRWARAQRDRDPLDQACKAAHRIHGTAGMYGIPALGEAAGRLEAAVKCIGTPDGPAHLWEDANAALRELRALVRALTSELDGTQPYVLLVGAPSPAAVALWTRFASERALMVHAEPSLSGSLQRVRSAPPDFVHVTTARAPLAWARALRMCPGCAEVPVVVAVDTADPCLWTGAVCCTDDELPAQLAALSPSGYSVAILASADVEEQVQTALLASGIRAARYRHGAQVDLYIVGPSVRDIPALPRARTLRLIEEFSPAVRRVAMTDAADFAAIPVIAEELIQRLSSLAHRLEATTASSASGLPKTLRLAEQVDELRPDRGCVAVAAIRARELGALDDRLGAGARAEAITMAGYVLAARFPIGSVRGQLDDGGLAVALVAPTPAAALAAVRAAVTELSGMAFVLEAGTAHLNFRAGVAWTRAQPNANGLIHLANEVQIRAACAPQRGCLALAAELE